MSQKIFLRILQVLIVIMGVGAIIVLLWEPQIEGRNSHATQFEIYFKDPFLMVAYLASISFFVSLYQVYKLLGYIRINNFRSQKSIKALKIIKYCAITLIVFALAAEIYFFTIQRNRGEDIAGGVVLGFGMIVITAMMAFFANKIAKLLQNGRNIESPDKN